jgi:hypothetical protein
VKKLLVAITVCGMTAAQSWALDLTTFKRFLLPVYTDTTPGAFGSQWKSFLALYNGAAVSAGFYPGACNLSACPIPVGSVDPHTTSIVNAVPGTPGRLFYISKDVADKVWLELRTQDLSRQSLTWGTEIPVIPDDRLFTGTIELVNVPIDERFRQTLRVYEPDATGTAAVVVRVFSGTSGPEVAELTLPLTVQPEAFPGMEPGYASISWVAQRFPEAAGQTTIRIEIEPATPGLRYWAFVSVGNNETQHVTTILPQP